MSIIGAWGSNDKLGVVWIMMSPRRRFARHKQWGWYMVIQRPLLRYSGQLITMKVVAGGTWLSRDSNTNKTIQAWSMLYKLLQKPMMFTPPAGSNHQKHSDTWNFSSDQTQ